VKEGFVKLVLLAVILNPSLDLLLSEILQNRIVLLRYSKFVQELLVFARFFIAEEDLQTLLFVYEECLFAMQADECETVLDEYLIRHLDFVVLLGILFIGIPGPGYLLDLLLNFLDGHPIDAGMAARIPLHSDFLLDHDGGLGLYLGLGL